MPVFKSGYKEAFIFKPVTILKNTSEDIPNSIYYKFNLSGVLSKKWENNYLNLTLKTSNSFYFDNNRLSIKKFPSNLDAFVSNLGSSKQFFLDEGINIWIRDTIKKNYINTYDFFIKEIEEPNKDPFNDGSEIAFWKFNDNLNDEYNSHNGSWHGSSIYTKAVWFNGVRFNGGNYISIPSIDLNNKSFTFSLWAKELSTGSHCYLSGGSDSQNNGLYIGWRDSTYFTVAFWANDVNYNLGQSNYMDKFYQYVITFDITTNISKLYIDGVYIGEYTHPTYYHSNFNTIGRCIESNDRYCNSIIDNLRLFNRPLSDEEIQQLYELEKFNIEVENSPNIFDFFDDFNNLNNWNIDNNAGITIENSNLKLTNTSGRLHTKNSISEPIAIDIKFKVPSFPSNGIMVNGVYNNSSDNIGLLIHPDAPNHYFYRVDGSWHGSYTFNGSFYNWALSYMEFNEGKVNCYLYQWDSTNNPQIYTWNKTINNYYITLGTRYDNSYTGQSCLTYIDWVRKRKLLTQNLTINKLSEETGEWVINGEKCNKKIKIIIKNYGPNDVNDTHINIPFSLINNKYFYIIKEKSQYIDNVPYWYDKDVNIWIKSNVSSNNSINYYIYYDDFKDPFKDNSEIAFYKFDGNVNDEYGNYNGTWHGNELYDNGIWGKSVYFNGNSYISATMDINSYSGITFSFWAKFSSTGGKIVGFSGNADMAIQMSGGSNVRVYYRSHLNYSDINNFFITNTWNHYVIVSDSSGTRHYRNGILIGTSGQRKSSVDNPFTIGAVSDGSFSYYHGYLENLRVFNRALSDSEVQQLYNLEKPNYGNGEEIFEFFDDFNTFDKWEQVAGSSDKVGINNGHLYLGDAIVAVRNKSELQLPNKCVVEMKGYATDWNESIEFSLSATNDYRTNDQGINDGVNYGWWGWSGSDNVLRIYQNGNSVKGNTHSAPSGSNNIYYYFLGSYDGSNAYHYQQTSSRIFNEDISLSDDLYNNVKWKHLFINSWSGSVWYIDYIFVRKYASSEPSISYGNEEEGEWEINGDIYKKRKLVTIFNNSSNILENFQVPLNYNQFNYIGEIIIKETAEQCVDEFNYISNNVSLSSGNITNNYQNGCYPWNDRSYAAKNTSACFLGKPYWKKAHHVNGTLTYNGNKPLHVYISHDGRDSLSGYYNQGFILISSLSADTTLGESGSNPRKILYKKIYKNESFSVYDYAHGAGYAIFSCDCPIG